jgi:hypothetical protein
MSKVKVKSNVKKEAEVMAEVESSEAKSTEESREHSEASGDVGEPGTNVGSGDSSPADGNVSEVSDGSEPVESPSDVVSEDAEPDTCKSVDRLKAIEHAIKILTLEIDAVKKLVTG